MGMVRVYVNGSFGNRDQTFPAMQHGHAHAVTEAIQYLVNEELPRAIAHDHRLQEEGAYPHGGFDKGDQNSDSDRKEQ